LMDALSTITFNCHNDNKATKAIIEKACENEVLLVMLQEANIDAILKMMASEEFRFGVEIHPWNVVTLYDTNVFHTSTTIPATSHAELPGYDRFGTFGCFVLFTKNEDWLLIVNCHAPHPIEITSSGEKVLNTEQAEKMFHIMRESQIQQIQQVVGKGGYIGSVCGADMNEAGHPWPQKGDGNGCTVDLNFSGPLNHHHTDVSCVGYTYPTNYKGKGGCFHFDKLVFSIPSKHTCYCERLEDMGSDHFPVAGYVFFI